MQIAILDVETTDLDPKKGEVIEVAAVRMDIDTLSIIESHSILIATGAPNPIEHINHIPSAALDKGWPKSVAWHVVGELCCDSGVDYIVAHNADFDRQWTPEDIASMPWADTCYGVDWPKQSKPGASLISLALDHGLAVVDPHRALNDCLLLARLLVRISELGVDVKEFIIKAARPRAEYEALVSYDDRHKASSKGFHWNPNTKAWTRKLVVDEVDFLMIEWGFDLAPYDEATALARVQKKGR